MKQFYRIHEAGQSSLISAPSTLRYCWGGAAPHPVRGEPPTHVRHSRTWTLKHHPVPCGLKEIPTRAIHAYPGWPVWWGDALSLWTGREALLPPPHGGAGGALWEEARARRGQAGAEPPRHAEGQTQCFFRQEEARPYGLEEDIIWKEIDFLPRKAGAPPPGLSQIAGSQCIGQRWMR